MGFLDWFTGSTPAGIAGEASKAAVGSIFDGVKGLIEEFHLPPEQQAKLDLAMEQSKLAFYQAQISDAQSARQMQMTTRSIWPGLLSLITLTGYFVGGWYILRYGLPATTDAGREVLIIWAQTMVNGVTLVFGFWLGSSNGSQSKDVLLHQSTPVK
jgi:hypothetical protein